VSTAGSKTAPVLSLLLHDVTDKPQLSGFMQPTASRYKHSTTVFQQYLDVVEQSGVSVSTLDQTTLPAIADKCIAGHKCSVAFTFDDGGASAPIAADMLEQRNWRGIFFVTTDLIGTKGFLSASQIRDLAQRGHVIGSHSCSHPDVFRRLNRQQMKYEWSQSRTVLEGLLGRNVDVASVPGGDCDNITIEEAAQAGLTNLFTSEQVTSSWQQAGATCFGRMMMLNNTPPETLQRWLRYPQVGVLPERAMRFAKSSVKSLMGPLYPKLMHRRRAMHEHA